MTKVNFDGTSPAKEKKSKKPELNVEATMGGQLATAQKAGKLADRSSESGQRITVSKEEIYAAVEISDRADATNLAVYSGRMDIAVVNPSEITADGLISQGYSMSGAEAAQRLALLENTKNGLAVAIAEEETVQLGIELETNRQKTAEKSFDYSRQVSKTQNAKDAAQHEHFMTGINQKKRKFHRIAAVADTVNIAASAGKKVAKASTAQLPSDMNLAALLSSAAANEQPNLGGNDGQR